MKKQLHFPVENRGIMICGTNFQHSKYFQGGNATKKDNGEPNATGFSCFPFLGEKNHH